MPTVAPGNEPNSVHIGFGTEPDILLCGARWRSRPATRTADAATRVSIFVQINVFVANKNFSVNHIAQNRTFLRPWYAGGCPPESDDTVISAVSRSTNVMEDDKVAAETQRLAYFAVCRALSPSHGAAASSGSSTEACLRVCVVRMLDRHAIVFNGMMTRLNIDRSVNFRQGFYEIAQELFKDAVSWSKIVALFAFGARLGQHCRDNGLEDLIEDIAGNLAAFANERIAPFVREEGGWVSSPKSVSVNIQLKCLT